MIETYKSFFHSAIVSFYFLPTLTFNIDGSKSNCRALKKILESFLEDKEKLVAEILISRNSFLDNFKRNTSSSNKKKKAPEISKYHNDKIKDLVSHGRLSKAMDFIDSVLHPSFVNSVDDLPKILNTFSSLHPDSVFDVSSGIEVASNSQKSWFNYF